MRLPDAPRHVAIVGGGVAGLSAARVLHQAGVAFTLLEATSSLGGRIRTDLHEGFRLDRGFQVILTGYPELRAALDLTALEPRAFRSGALVWMNGAFHRIADPFREPLAAWSTLRAPIGSLADKLRMIRMRSRCRSGSVEDQLAAPDETSASLLRRWGMSDAMVDRFFRPFLGGVFLDPDLETSARMLRFVFRMFAEGRAVLPSRGMEEIPRQMASRLPPTALRLESPVVTVRPEGVELATGEVVTASDVVIATDGGTAARLVPGVREPRWRAVTCFYFSAPRAPIEEPILILDGEGQGPIQNLCFPTQVSPDYGPPGRTLVSATAFGAAAGLRERVQERLVEWFGSEARAWTHLRTYEIPQALPSQVPGWLEPPARPNVVRPGLFLAGDHLDTASTNGALASGRRAAEAVLGRTRTGGGGAGPSVLP